MTDSLKERLRVLAARREMEGSYTDRNIAELALARIEELEAINLAQSLQVSEKIEQFQATIAKLEGELAEKKKIVDRVWKALGITTYEQANGMAIDEIVTTLQGNLDRARDTINKVFGIAYPHPSRTFDTMIKDMGLIDDLCRSILSDLTKPESEVMPTGTDDGKPSPLREATHVAQPSEDSAKPLGASELSPAATTGEKEDD